MHFALILKQKALFGVMALLLVAAAVRMPSLLVRSIWEDEATTLLETAGHFSPTWPSEPVYAGVLKKQYLEGTPTLGAIVEGLRRVDVHPPVYYSLLSLWRRWLGFSLETARTLSLICSLATILVLYLLLRSARIENPLVPTLIYSLTTVAIDYGTDARSYALATLLIMSSALYAYLASEHAPYHSKRAIIYALVMAVGCGIAFHTNYLTLFPTGVILLWSVMYLWRAWGVAALAFPLIAASIWALSLSTVLSQFNRPILGHSGFVGIVAEVVNVFGLTLGVLWTPKFIPRPQIRAFNNLAILVISYGGWLILISTTLVQLLRRWSATNRKFWILWFGLAIAPPLGLFLIDLLLDKVLHQIRYFVYAGPALAVFAAYGVARLMSSRPRLGTLVLMLLLGVQITGIYWGGWPDDRRTDRWARMARTIERTSSPSHVVLVVNTAIGDYPGALIYELDKLNPQTMVLVMSDQNEKETQAAIQEYTDIWLVFHKGLRKIIGEAVSENLQDVGDQVEVLYHEEDPISAIHIRRSVVPKP
jgi:hypothetical protein